MSLCSHPSLAGRIDLLLACFAKLHEMDETRRRQHVLSTSAREAIKFCTENKRGIKARDDIKSSVTNSTWKIGRWKYHQHRLYKEGHLCKEKISALESIPYWKWPEKRCLKETLLGARWHEESNKVP
jgi:hypothetical protein